jgi:hypothetical protein
MAITFPSSPTTNQIFTNSGRTWIYTGTTWQAYTQAVGSNSVTSTMIVDGTIVDADIASATITGAKLAANAAVTNIGFTPASTGKSIAMAIVFGG